MAAKKNNNVSSKKTPARRSAPLAKPTQPVPPPSAGVAARKPKAVRVAAKAQPKPREVAAPSVPPAAMREPSLRPLPPLPASMTPANVPASVVDVPHDLIARRAYEIWEEKMRLANDSLRNWTEAEAELRANFLRNQQ